MTQYRIKGWNKFQHFKDRRPPWVKLYRDLLDDMDWHELDGDSAKTLISLWLIASENEGQLPPMRKLAFRLRMTEKALSAVISQLDHWLEVDDNEPISARYQDDAPETETETETYKPETEKDTRAPRFDAQAHLVSIGVDASIAADWITHRKAKKAAITNTVIAGITREAIKAGKPLADVLEACCQRGWIGFKAEWLQNSQNDQRVVAFSTRRDIERDEVSRILCGSQPALPERVISGEVIHAS